MRSGPASDDARVPTGVGLVFPTVEIGDDPSLIAEWARTAESLGFSHVLVYDHVLLSVHEGREPPLRGVFDETTPFHEPFTLMCFLAGVTSTIELATGVLVLPQRQTALVAKQAAEVDLLSGGRLRLGIGSGWNYPEYEALGTSWATRGDRLDEQIDVLRLLWREPVVDFTGRYHRLDRVAVLPRPRRELPLWFGGHTVPAFRRAARAGDGLVVTPPEVHGLGPHTIKSVRRLVEEAGRDPAAFGFDAIVRVPNPGWETHVDSWRDANATYVSLVIDGLAGPDDHISILPDIARRLAL
jgi:probable F420-dependent oxidoreductase